MTCHPHATHTNADRQTGPARLAAILLAVSQMVIVAGCRERGASAMPTSERPPASVATMKAVASDVPVYLDAIGRTMSTEMVSVVPQVSGKLIAVHVQDGAYVTQGQLLFEIDPRPFQAALDSASAMLDQKRAQAEMARIEFERIEGLRSTDVATPLEFDQTKSALAVAQARIAAAEADVAAAKLNLEYTKIFSPIDGRAGARLVHSGNVVKANDMALLTIQRLDPIYAEFTVTENDLGTVRKYMATRGLDWGDSPEHGLKVLVDIPGDSSRVLSALGTPAPATQPTMNTAGPRTGTLCFLDNLVQTGTGVVKLRASVPNADRYLWPGQFVNVRLQLTTRMGAVLIPTAAQQIGQQGPYVYVVTEDNRAEIRPIVAGQRQGDRVVIDQGLRAGERVIVAGQMMVVPGGKVQPTDVNVATSQPEGSPDTIARVAP